jgi:hypothetical protein
MLLKLFVSCLLIALPVDVVGRLAGGLPSVDVLERLVGGLPSVDVLEGLAGELSSVDVVDLSERR